MEFAVKRREIRSPLALDVHALPPRWAANLMAYLLCENISQDFERHLLEGARKTSADDFESEAADRDAGIRQLDANRRCAVTITFAATKRPNVFTSGRCQLKLSPPADADGIR